MGLVRRLRKGFRTLRRRGLVIRLGTAEGRPFAWGYFDKRDGLTGEHRGGRYWKRRAPARYYEYVRRELGRFEPGGSLLDVGGHDTPVCAWGDFDSRVSVTLKPIRRRLPHVRYRIMDFMELPRAAQFDVVTCLQVLEHLDDDLVKDFARKLLMHARIATIVSVPFEWRRGHWPAHVQDPVDLDKLSSWFGRKPDAHAVILEDTGIERLVARFDSHAACT